jgi:lipopolysaccharide/colanic/teichoic acid biosynthesis glycosyltransferase
MSRNTIYWTPDRIEANPLLRVESGSKTMAVMLLPGASLVLLLRDRVPSRKRHPAPRCPRLLLGSITEVTKRAFDLTVGTVAVVLVSPLLALIAMLVVATMGTPVLFRDQRAGRGGRPFDLLKFRTMRPLRPGETIPDSDADRITPLGRVLRSTSLDELPSLVNVMRGEMSLVGPRPLPVRYVSRFSPRQARRLDATPGITGWAQVNGRNTLEWNEKLELDVWYVEHQSIWLDLRIIGTTLRQVLRREGVSYGDHATMPEFQGDQVRVPDDAAE